MYKGVLLYWLNERASAIIEPQERKSAHNFHSSLVRPVQRAAAARMLIAIYVDRSARGITADLGLDGQRASMAALNGVGPPETALDFTQPPPC